MFSRFDTIPESDRHTHRHTDRQTHYDGIYRASIASRGKNQLAFGEVMDKSLVSCFFGSQCSFYAFFKT